MADEPKVNPYAPPATDGGAATIGPATPGEGAFPQALFSPRQMLVAALLGSVVAGTILLQGNFRAMGRSRDANKALLCGLLASAAVFAVLLIIPDSVPSTPVSIAITLAFYKLADSLQGAAFLRHRAAGGARRSNWVVFGITIGSAVAVIVILLLIFETLVQSGLTR